MKSKPKDEGEGIGDKGNHTALLASGLNRKRYIRWLGL